jgi:hypothetical protein
MQTTKELTKRYQDIIKRFQHDEKIQVEAIRMSLKKL